MIKITGFNTIKNASNVKARKDTSSGGVKFFDFLGGAEETAATAETAPVEQAAAPSMLDAMLSLQEVPEDEIRRKKMMQRGKMTIDTLEQLRHGLLVGRVPKEVLSSLSQQIKNGREQISDPRLLEIMDDIELRAAVEIAKLEMSGGK